MLLDSSVLIAASVPSHPHRAASVALFELGARYTVAAHSLAELYNTLSRPSGYGWPADAASIAVVDAERRCKIITLTAEQFAQGVRAFAARQGVGPRVYDYLIGHHAVVHGIGTIVTLDQRDFRPLFPGLDILTPTQYLETL